MPVPSPRNKILPVRGDIATLQANIASILEGEICYAFDKDQYYQKENGVLVAAGASKDQGALADSAVQPGDNVSELVNDSGYITLAEVPGSAVTSVNSQIGDVVLGFADVGAASAAQGVLADSAVQPGDNVSDLVNDAGYITLAEVPPGGVTSVNTQTGDVVLGFADVGAASAAQGTLADSATQPGDNISTLVNDTGYITLAEVPPGGVTSVNTQTGDVVLDTDDISQGSANLYSQWDDVTGGIGYASGDVLIGGTLPSAPNVTIETTGAITTAADATINDMTVGLGGGSQASNVAFGSAALASNTTGLYNVAIGRNALTVSNANSNTAIGHNTLLVNTTGAANLAIGRQSLKDNTEGGSNTAVGYRSLFVNTTGIRNTAIGDSSLFSNLTGSRNTAIGRFAGYYIEGDDNTVIGGYQGTSADSTLNDTVIISAGLTEKLRIDSTGSLLFGGTLPGTPNITLNADGTGSFAGKLTSVSTVTEDVGTILATKDYVDSNSGGGGIDPVISGMIF